MPLPSLRATQRDAQIQTLRPRKVHVPFSHLTQLFHAPNTSPILHLLTPPLLHFRLPLTRPRRTRLRHARCIRKPALHPRIRRPRRIHTIQRDNAPQPPRPVARNRYEEHNAVCPVDHVPHVLCQPFAVEVGAGARDAAIGGVGGAGLALEEELDGELRGGEEEVEEQGAARVGGVVEEGAQEPVEGVEEEG